MIRDCASNVQYQNQIGCNDSTFRGLSEIERAAKAMGARANLTFQQESVEFSLTMPMVQQQHWMTAARKRRRAEQTAAALRPVEVAVVLARVHFWHWR